MILLSAELRRNLYGYPFAGGLDKNNKNTRATCSLSTKVYGIELSSPVSKRAYTVAVNPIPMQNTASACHSSDKPTFGNKQFMRMKAFSLNT